MTRGDVFLLVLSELIGCSPQEIPPVTLTALRKYLGYQIFDKELPDYHAQTLLAALRQENKILRDWMYHVKFDGGSTIH